MFPSSPRPAAVRACAVAATCASALVAGLSLSDAQAQSLYPVVVTATRSETTIDRALADVTLIDAQAVREAGTATLPELLRSAGGIEISQTGGAGSLSGLFVRGTRNSQTVVLVDGIRMENPLSGGGLIENLPLSSVDRIEIVRGPASSMYGSGAIGGVVQIFTRAPDAEGVRPFASAAAGSRGTAHAQAGFRAARDGTRVALGLSHDRTSGFEATRPGSGWRSPNASPAHPKRRRRRGCGEGSKKESSFSVEKEAKRLSSAGAEATAGATAPADESFLVLF